MKISNSFKLIGISVVASLFLAACSTNSVVDSSKLSVSNSGMIAPVQDLTFDWGDINIQGGKVDRTFKLKNTGEEDLIIKSATTSCMCTNAEITLKDGTKSPNFTMGMGMGGDVQWGGIVKANEEFEVKVVFDPLAHGPDAVGPIQRVVSITTSSKSNGNYAKPANHGDGMVTEINLLGNVLSDKDYQAKYQKKNDIGGFLFNEIEYDFGTVKQSGGVVSHNFDFEYVGENPVKITAVPTSCACTTAEVSNKELKKGDKGVLTVKFDPNLHEEPHEKFFKTITLITDPKLDKQPEVKIWAEVNLDLGPEAYKLKETHKD